MPRVNPETKPRTREHLLDVGAEQFARHDLVAANVDRTLLAAGLAKHSPVNLYRRIRHRLREGGPS